MSFIAANPYTIALRLLSAGVREIEGPRANSLIVAMNAGAGAGANEVDPWCGSFVHFCHWILGYRCPNNPAGARQWLHAGKPIDIDDVQRGDVVIFWRDSIAGWKGHVGFFHGWKDGEIILLGGNQSDKVSLAVMPKNRVLGCRRPEQEFKFDTALAALAKPENAGKEV
jgi:uncharacterized protein (TIGR02594 family)